MLDESALLDLEQELEFVLLQGSERSISLAWMIVAVV
ncbi:hypothetical protein MNBD_CHLOROFLEXI01-327 [hydrothermal vent metagenome]|uniref:Uncharacterized protein n=1 Tax=hydrothermal vent metagenome TaxID=652676 RepID=A0A3B0V3Q8_9ZZZZ